MPSDVSHPHYPERYCSERTLPARAFLPGFSPAGSRPEESRDDSSWNGQATTLGAAAGFRWGLDLFNGGFYWEAHETWEALWMQANADTACRFYLQGLIQFAAAMLKSRRGQWRSFDSLYSRASEKFSGAAVGEGYEEISWLVVPSRAVFENYRKCREVPRIVVSMHEALALPRDGDSPVRILREVTQDDLPTLFAHQQEPEGAAMAGVPARGLEAFMAHWHRTILASDEVRKFAIVEGGQLKGNIVSWAQDGERLVGYWLGKAYWGQGVATRALREFLALHELQRPLVAYVAKGNRGSIRVLQRCMFAIAKGEGLEGADEELRLELAAPQPA